MKEHNNNNKKKVGNRRKARESALRILYLCDNCRLSEEDAKDILWKIGEYSEKVYLFANELLKGIFEKRGEIDDSISKCAKNWKIERMATIDRNILRIATYEILNMPETPISVIIDEAVEIAKTFSTADSSKFVNGILDKLKTARNNV
jgi:N utilization substance protein B